MDAQFKDTDASLAFALRRTAANLQGDKVTLQELLEMVGEQGLLVFCSLLTVPFLFPVSIPGISTVFGVIVILIGVGVTLNRVPWLPQQVMRRTITREHLTTLLERGAKAFDRIERWVKPRFGFLTTGNFIHQINGLLLTASGVLLLFPLSFVPFSNTLPAVAILSLAFGTIQRDGYVILLGYVAFCLTLLYFGGFALALVLGGQMLFH